MLSFVFFALCMSFTVEAQWSPVGPLGFSGARADNISLAFNRNGDPYVAYAPFTGSRKISVLKWVDPNWILIGNPDFSAGFAEDISLAFNPVTDIPYVAYRDYGTSFKATVMYLINPIMWGPLGGSAGFTPSGASGTSLAFNAAGDAFVAFSDAAVGGKASVMKYPTGGGSWGYVGSPGFSAGTAGFT